jgi:hypothetical protein
MERSNGTSGGSVALGGLGPPAASTGRLIGGALLLASAVAGLHLLGSGTLAAPPADPGRWAAWAAERTPLEAAFAVARVLVLLVGWYLTVLTLLASLARGVRAAHLAAAAERVALPPLRPLVRTIGTGVAVGCAAVTLTPVALPAARAHDPPSAAAPMPPLPAHDPAALPGSSFGLPTELVWTVRPGDHLWGIADDVLCRAWGRTPAVADVAAYWRGVVAANRSRLADPANPDLILPGDTLMLPPTPLAP